MPSNNKKKKKTPSNPARGFATVSVPSKPKLESTADTPTTTAADSEATSQNDAQSSRPGSRPTDETVSEISQAGPSLHNYSPEELEKHLEEAELQIFVDKYSTKCKADAVRQATKLETEKRVLRQQAVSLSLLEWLPSDVQDRILELATVEEHEYLLSSAKSANAKTLVPDEELHSRLWTLKETLLKLGFSPERTEEALKHVLSYFAGAPAPSGRDIAWNLDEAMEWLAMHSQKEELPSYTQITGRSSKEDDSVTSWMADLGLSRPSSPKPQNGASLSKQQGDWKAAKTATPVSYDSDSSIDPDTMVTEWLDLQTRLYGLQPDLFDRPGGKGKKARGIAKDISSDPAVAKLQRKAARIERDVLFEAQEAEFIWRSKLDELRKDATFVQRPTEPRKKPQGPVSPKKDSGDAAIDIEEDDAGLLGDIFEADANDGSILGLPQPTNEMKFTIRDFGKTVGLSPRRVLEESCKARDSACKIVYQDVSTSSHQCRKALEVRWSKPQETPFPLVIESVTHKSNSLATFLSMDAIVTPDSQQAEGYVSTLALFILFTQSSKEGKAYLRIPAVWRDLWTEFSTLKKRQEDDLDKATVKDLKRLVDENQATFEDDVVLLDNFRKRNGTASKPGSPMKGSTRGDYFGQVEHLQDIWLAKTTTPAFQRMMQGRMNLPIWNFKEEILSTLDTHQALIICSETGSGKSTQIPSYILEHAMLQGRHCKVYVTEPRRISAISLARRVSEELGENKNDVGTNRSLIGFAVRLESKVTAATRLVYATTGVVVRMLERPDDFQDITHVVLDEVHERTIDSDFLLVVLRRLMQKRTDLKLILMSATVDAQRFSTYLGGVPVLNIPGRTFPVEMKYLEDAVEMTNYRLLEDASNSVVQDDVDEVSDATGENTGGLQASLDGYSKQTKETILKFDEYRMDYQLIKSLLLKIATAPEMEMYSRAILVFMPGLAEIRRLNDEILAEPTFQSGWIVHALHSSIASEDQEKAFNVPPDGFRKIVIATNIAETGITIPDITAVVDTGKEKMMRFDERRQLSRLVESFISRANAKQRRGRAGRVRNGICFHLFTKFRHDSLLAEQQTPEMLRLSLQDLVLRVKICKLGEVEQTLTEALDPPSSKNIRRAIDSLKEVKALTSNESLTPLGSQLAKLPLDVFLGKLIIHGAFFKCLDAAVTIAAILSSKSPFVNTMGSNAQRDSARNSFQRGDSDLLTVYNAYCCWKRAKTTPGMSEFSFCRKNCLSPQTLLSIEDVKMQLVVSVADAGLITLDAAQKAALNRARSSNRNRQFFTIPEQHDLNSANDVVINSVVAWSFYPKLLAREGKGWRNVANNQAVTLHPTSINKRADSAIKWLSYYHIMQARNRNLNAHDTSAVDDFAISLLCGDADFKLYSGVISIDANRIRFATHNWKSMLAMKTLNSRLRDILASTFRTPHRPLSYKQQQWLDIWQDVFALAAKR
ncbi:DEAD box ATP-dependent RNA helicase [Penicillium ucsense]|uniref:RNA helicase n=1 Tax=Penicillium ucsense TaxID=2839758 RepID=A0A8J8W802_9EURO|nr:DEAD box ATP-dependent RNA helicase [Penicillium ucsense]KAF7735246.1 DEAD box ATP-dependent RNA helicase [Penicillium ucsense]